MSRSASPVALDPARIIQTARTLGARIETRFPNSGLAGLSAHLVGIAEQTVGRIERVTRANVPLRIGTAILTLLIPVTLVAFIMRARLSTEASDIYQFLEGMEAGFNAFLLLGAGLLFLVTLESRLRRRRALRELSELRAFSHIVDMHQLTKDPSGAVIHRAEATELTESGYDRDALVTYLDFASELLAIVSKLAALYGQAIDDSVVLGAVDEVESLTTGLSSKIWQKIMILDRATP